jgi:hypothetical protein
MFAWLSAEKGPDAFWRVQQDVARVDISMDDAALVGIGQGLGHLGCQLGRLAKRQAVLAEPGRQSGPFDVLADQAGQAILVRDFVERDDVGMVQVGGTAGLAQKPLRADPGKGLTISISPPSIATARPTSMLPAASPVRPTSIPMAVPTLSAVHTTRPPAAAVIRFHQMLLFSNSTPPISWSGWTTCRGWE